MLAKGKLNSIETLMSQALIDLDIIREEFKIIVNEKEKYHGGGEIARDKSSNRKKNFRMNLKMFS